MTACAIETEAAAEDGRSPQRASPSPRTARTPPGSPPDGRGRLVPGALDAGRPRAVRGAAARQPARGARHRGAAAGRRAGADPPAEGRAARPSRCSTRPGPAPASVRWAPSSARSGTELRLLPPAPGGEQAYALAVGRTTSTGVAGGGRRLPARARRGAARGAARAASGWTVTGRMLALDRGASAGRTKAVAVDLERAARSRRCCRSPRTATTGCCSPTRTAACC